MILLMLLVIGIILKDDYSIILIQLSKISLILFLYSMNRFPQLYIKISSLLILFLKKLHFIQDPETLFIKGKDMIDQFNIHTSQLKQNKRNISNYHHSWLPSFAALCRTLSHCTFTSITSDTRRFVSSHIYFLFCAYAECFDTASGRCRMERRHVYISVYEHVYQKCCRKHDDLMAFCYFLFEYYFRCLLFYYVKKKV